MKKFILIACLMSTPVFSMTLEECKAESSSFNKSLPSTVDRITRLNGTACYLDQNNQVVISFNFQQTEATASPVNFNLLQNKLKQIYCTSPDSLRKFGVAVESIYFSPDYKYLGKVENYPADCTSN